MHTPHTWHHCMCACVYEFLLQILRTFSDALSAQMFLSYARQEVLLLAEFYSKIENGNSMACTFTMIFYHVLYDISLNHIENSGKKEHQMSANKRYKFIN